MKRSPNSYALIVKYTRARAPFPITYVENDRTTGLLSKKMLQAMHGTLKNKTVVPYRFDALPIPLVALRHKPLKQFWASGISNSSTN